MLIINNVLMDRTKVLTIRQILIANVGHDVNAGRMSASEGLLRLDELKNHQGVV